MKKRIAYLKNHKVDKALSDKTFDFCALCWSKTNILKSAPIETRLCYVEGVGQLCPKCYSDLYVKSKP